MKKLFLITLLAPLSLFSEIDEAKLVSYLHDRIDEVSYQITHAADQNGIDVAYRIGYFNALCQLNYYIEKGEFKIKLSEPVYPESPKGMNGVHKD